MFQSAITDVRDEAELAGTTDRTDDEVSRPVDSAESEINLVFATIAFSLAISATVPQLSRLLAKVFAPVADIGPAPSQYCNTPVNELRSA